MIIPAIQDIVFDTKNMNSNINKSETLVQLINRSWFENLVHQAMRNYEQMQLNTTSKIQSNRFNLHNDIVSEKELVARDIKESSDTGFLLQGNGMDSVMKYLRAWKVKR